MNVARRGECAGDEEGNGETSAEAEAELNKYSQCLQGLPVRVRQGVNSIGLLLVREMTPVLARVSSIKGRMYKLLK